MLIGLPSEPWAFWSIGRNAHRLYSFNKLRPVYRKYRAFTMIDGPAYIKNLRIAHSFRHIPGCVIECGVWRGGMIAGFADVLGPDREYFLFDSFEGLPPAREIDGPAALRWQANTQSPRYHDNCKAAADDARIAMDLSAAAHFSLLKGWFDETIPPFSPPNPIAVLRLDADWYESTLTCLKYLYPHVAPGGVVIIDDYEPWDGCAQAVHEFLVTNTSSGVPRIRQYENSVYFFVKPSNISESVDSVALDHHVADRAELR
jgi:O-methyltransferase